jgi:putative flippase GtrA
MIKQELFLKLLRFGITGGLSALTLMGLTQLFAGWWGKQIGFLTAYPVALFVHFSLNKWWTFNSRTKVDVRQVRDYGLLSLATFLLQWSVYTLVTSWLKAPLFIGTLSSVAAQMALSFIVMERRVFAARAAARPAE